MKQTTAKRFPRIPFFPPSSARRKYKPAEIEFHFLLSSFLRTPTAAGTVQRMRLRRGRRRFRGMFVTDFVQLARHVESTDLSTTRVSSFSVPFALQLQLNLFLLFPSPSTSISSFPHPLKKAPYSRFSYILFSPALPCPSFSFSLFIHLLLPVVSRYRKKGSCLSGGGGLSLIKLFARRRN